VKMRRVAVAIEDCDRDSEEAGDDGHVAMIGRPDGLLLWRIDKA